MKRIIDLLLASLTSILLFVSCQDVEEPVNTVPTVTTTEVKDIGMLDAMAYGTVASQPNCNFLLSTQPDLADATKYFAWSIDKEAGIYEGKLDDLTPGTTYYVALCASDNYSEIVGNVISFKTASCLGLESVTWTNWDEEQTTQFTNSPMGTFVYTIADDVLHADYVNLQTTYANGKWTLSPNATIGLSNQTKRIYAYYPYNTEQKEATTIHVYANSDDVLYGQSQDLSDSNPNATIALKHAMAKVTFEIIKAEGATLDVTIGGANLRNNFEGNVNAIRLDGFLNLFTGEIVEGAVDYGHDGLLQECEVPVSSETTHAIDYYVIPNSFAANQAMLILYDINNWGNSFTAYFGETSWEAGLHYTYNIIVSPQGLQIGDVRVEDWENNNGGSITIN